MSINRIIALISVGVISVGIASAQFKGPAPVAWRWQQPTTIVPDSTPVVSGDVVYVASGQRVYALNRADGNQVWRFPVGQPLAAFFKGTPVVSGGTVYATADNKILYAIDAQTGQQKWIYRSDSNFVGSPEISGNTILFANSDGNIMAVDAGSGQPFYTAPLVVQDGLVGQFGVWKDEIIAFTGANSLVAINVASRHLDWKDDFTEANPDGHPVIVGDSVFVNTAVYLVSLSAANGREIFSKTIGSDLAYWPGVSDSGVTTVTKDGNVYCYDLTGQAINKDPINLGSYPITAPTGLNGGTFVYPTANGAINLVDPNKGIIWTYLVRPIGGPQEDTSSQNTNNGQNGIGPKGGGQGLGSSGSGFGQKGGGNQGNNISRGQTDPNATKVVTIQASAPDALAGTTLLQICRDGSLIAFDPTNGVDLTPPTVDMTFPLPGSTVSGQPPLALVFKIDDQSSGVNASTLKITINGKLFTVTLDKSGLATVHFSTIEGGNAPLNDGLQTIDVTVSDWLGNVETKTFTLHIDNTLPPVQDISDQNQNGTGKGSGFGGKSGGGGAGAAGS